VRQHFTPKTRSKVCTAQPCSAASKATTLYKEQLLITCTTSLGLERTCCVFGQSLNITKNHGTSFVFLDLSFFFINRLSSFFFFSFLFLFFSFLFFSFSFLFFSFFSFFFLSSHFNRYFGLEVDLVDDILLSIKVPTQVTRRPRSLSKHLAYWKASEVRSWILYFSVPILSSFLPQSYYLHWCCFVLGFWLLLQPSISPAHLQLADGLLKTFYQQLATLYGSFLESPSFSLTHSQSSLIDVKPGPCYCTMNVHNLIHWKLNVERAGPLWATSCFLFESENGKIDDEIQGTNNVVMMVSPIHIFYFILLAFSHAKPLSFRCFTDST